MTKENMSRAVPQVQVPCPPAAPILSLLFLLFFFSLFKISVLKMLEVYQDNLLTPGTFISKQNTWALTVLAALAKACRSVSDGAVVRVTYRHSYTGCATRCSQDLFLCETRYSVLPTRWKPVPGHKNQIMSRKPGFSYFSALGR